MRGWQYRSILFEFTKNGLLGDKYVDDEEVETVLNEMGGQGWELVNVVLLQDGLLAFLKMGLGASARMTPEPDEVEDAPVMRPPIHQPQMVERELDDQEESQAGPREPFLPQGRPRQDTVRKKEPDFFDDIRIS